MNATAHPHVVIVGAGFGGLSSAHRLGGAGFPVTIIDRTNYHLFVPLLYQVATAALSPADIAQPVRKLLRRYDNVEVVMGDVVGVDADKRRVQLADGSAIGYDRLIEIRTEYWQSMTTFEMQMVEAVLTFKPPENSNRTIDPP